VFALASYDESALPVRFFEWRDEAVFDENPTLFRGLLDERFGKLACLTTFCKKHDLLSQIRHELSFFTLFAARFYSAMMGDLSRRHLDLGNRDVSSELFFKRKSHLLKVATFD